MSRAKVAKSAGQPEPTPGGGTRQLMRAGLASLMLYSFAGCPAPHVQPDLPLKMLQDQVKDLAGKVVMLNRELDDMQLTFWSEKKCQDQKSREKIAGFMSAVQKGSSAVCTPMETEKALAFMPSQPVAYAYLDPKYGLSSLHTARASYIREELLKESNLHPSTRILILFQPYEETEKAIETSQAIVKTFVDKIRRELPSTLNSAVTLLGPNRLPCNLQSEATLATLYKGSQLTKLKETLVGEPSAKQPRIRIWVFRTDCQ